jgi:hypothetical protein
MTIRTTQRSVTFDRPFSLKGVEGVQPAGTYLVEMDDEALDSASRIAYRRVRTLMHIQREGAEQVIILDPADARALLGDVDPV